MEAVKAKSRKWAKVYKCDSRFGREVLPKDNIQTYYSSVCRQHRRWTRGIFKMSRTLLP